MKLYYKKYSPEFADGIMFGTGRIAGTLMSKEDKEVFALNHERLYGGLYRNRESRIVKPETLAKVRELIHTGDRAEATRFTIDALSNSGAGSIPHRIDPYKPGGLLSLKINNLGDDYVRELDTDHAVGRVTRGNVTYTFFADIDSDRIFVYIDGQASIEAIIDFLPDSRMWYSRELDIADDGKFATMAAVGEYRFGVFFQTRVDIYTDGAIRKTNTATIDVHRHAVLVIDLEVGDDARQVHDILDARRVYPKAKEDQLAQHVKRWHSISDKAFHIKENATTRISNENAETLMAKVRENGATPEVLRILSDFDIYMCISAGANAKELLNLQGKWNMDPRPAWNCDHHYDCNVEACYWPYDKAGIGECGNSLFDYCEAVLPAARVTAQRMFGCRGAFFSFTDDVWKRSTQEAHTWDVWVCAGPWLASHFWKHYEYTGDLNFLKNRAYSFIKEIAQFFEDFLYADENGVLQISPTQSPENRYKEAMCETFHTTTSVCESPAIDITLVNELLTNAIRCADILGIDKDKVSLWEDILQHLQPLRIDPKNGRLLEWDKPFEEGWPDHFHYSPVYGVYPCGSINEIDTKEYFEASRKLFAHRIASGSVVKHCWPLGTHWASCLHSAFDNADEAYSCIDWQIGRSTADSLLSILDNPVYGRVFQFENCSTRLNAIIDLFALSLAGRVKLTKKIPEKLGGIGYENLHLKGGFVAEADYDMGGNIIECRIRSVLGNPLCLVGNWQVEGCETRAENGCTVLNTVAGSIYKIRVVS